MKYTLILIIMLAGADCLGQTWTYSGGFSPQGSSSFFRAPIGTEITLSTSFSWTTSGNPKLAPGISPVFVFDSSAIATTVIIHTQWEYGNGGTGNENLTILINSDTPECLIPMTPGGGISAYYYFYNPDSLISFYAYYPIQGVFYDPNIIGKISGPDSLYCGSVPIDSTAKARLNLINNTLAQYRQIKVLSVHPPFSLDDTIEMMYPCIDYIYHSLPNCYFHPTAPGHYVDTAKLLDSLTNDTISVVLIGDAYDAGVSDVKVQPVKLFPNPCDRDLQIDIPSEESAQIEIYNLFGERVYSSNAQASNATIDCSQFPAGVYFVLINGMTSHTTQKLIVTH